MDSSPVRGSQARKGPLSSRSVNLSSPSKTVYLENKCGENGSPWRIKVTVQAEPTSPSINRSVRSTRDTQSSSPVKRSTTRTRKTLSSPVNDSSQRSAPARRRNNSVQAHDLIEIPNDATNDYSLSEIEDAHPPTETDDEQQRSFSGNTINSYYFQHPTGASDKQQTRIPDVQIHRPQTAPVVQSHDRANTSPGFPTENWTDDEEDAALGAQGPGEVTMLENEEFSMISVDSLASHPRLHDHLPADALSASAQKEPMTKNGNTSYMASSPPAYLPRVRHTPLPSDSPPNKYPAAPVQSSCHHANVDTPLQESARKSGRALQDVLTGPFRESSSRTSESSHDNVFAGFSAGTRRQLRQSLYTGQSLATPQLGNQPNFGLGVQAPHFPASMQASTFASPFHSPVRVEHNVTAHRLPTPEEGEGLQPQAVAEVSSDAASQVQYPSLAAALHTPVIAGPYIEQDAMSWIATSRSAGKTENQSIAGHELSQGEDPCSPESTHRSTPRSAATIEEGLVEASQKERPSSQPTQIDASEPSKDIWQEEAEDIWQEEASRSINEDHTPPILREDMVVKPRRGKLPGTWRRTSEAHFSYSDSPEPEEVSTRKVSATTSASGIMTPPVTEDERQQEKVFSPIGDDAKDDVEENDEDDDDDDEDGGDSGAFWQSNLPAIFNRPARSSARRMRTVSASPSLEDDEPVEQSFAGESPLRNTVLDLSPEKAQRSPLKWTRIAGGIKRNPQSDSALLPSPLKHSLLRSSKVRNTSIGKSTSTWVQSQSIHQTFRHDEEVSGNSAKVTDSSDCGNSSSMASDARQLHNELKSQLGTGSGNSTVDFIHTPAETICEEDTPQSYVEELNRDSPLKIRVNFGDSSMAPFEQDNAAKRHDTQGRSMLLSPKKNYPPLFDNAPTLPVTTDDSTVKDKGGRPARKNGFVSRLTDSFWEAVTVPPPVDAQKVKSIVVVSDSPTSAPVPAIKCDKVPTSAKPKKAAKSSKTTPPSVPDHVLRLRRKYGILPQTHPFTYAHIRTLHRMLNSVRSPHPSIIPSSGPLCPELAAMVNKTVSNELDQRFTWTEKYLHVVESYMCLLLPASERKRLVELTGKEWGDEEAVRYKGFDSKNRHGSQKVFKIEVKGRVEISWVVGIVEGILFKEEMNEKKKRIQMLMEQPSISEA